MTPSSPPPATEFTLFPRLPAELRQRVFELAMLPRIVCFNDIPSRFQYTEDDLTRLVRRSCPVVWVKPPFLGCSLLSVSYEARQVALQHQSFTFVRKDGRIERMNPEQDVFWTSHSRYPKKGLRDDPTIVPVPFHRIVSTGNALWPFWGSHDAVDRRLDLHYYPCLKEYTWAFSGGPPFSLEGELVRYAHAGPHVINNYHGTCSQPGCRAPLHIQERDEEAMAYSDSKGITGDTGLHWSPLIRRRISFMPFTKTPVWTGGYWFGFRYFVAEGRVEFSPLWFDEVADVLATHPRGRFHPRDIIKLWIVRPGDDGNQMPPTRDHHCWEEIQLADSLLGGNQVAARRMWNYLCILMAQYTGVYREGLSAS